MLCRLVLGLLILCLGQTAQAFQFTTVIIDAGHGGMDGGAVWNGLLEKKLSLDVAKRLETALKARGVRTVMTRSTDKTVSLDARVALANRYRNSVFVCIHFNANRNRTISGIETFYRSASGRVLARAIQRSLDARVTGINRGVCYADYKVLRETRMPAALVECGFISNRTEAARCATAAHRQKLAEAIASGILAARN
jgi:N-acetylmuramoyl-L-alanine amidase